MSGADLLLVATLAVPVGMLFACLSRRVREGMSTFLGLAPLPGLAAALLAADGPPLVLDEAGRQFTLALDPPGAILLGVAALLWSIAGIYARTYIGVGPAAGRFSEWWLLTLTGSLGVFIAADLVSFYVTFTLASLAAWGLVIHEGTPGTLRAGVIYLGLAVLAEISLLMAFVLLATATPGSSLAIRDAMAVLPASPWRDATLAFLIVGFGLKVGLVPLHVWLPLAYAAAPIPAAAVISGAMSKAGVIGLLRFLPLDAALPDWGAALAAAGLVSAFYGVAVGITQPNPKDCTRLFEREPDGFHRHRAGHGAGRGRRRRDHGNAFYAAHHVLAKGALFLAVGVIAASGARRLWPVLLPAAVLALGFGGLPLTGGCAGEAGSQSTARRGRRGPARDAGRGGQHAAMLHFLHRLRGRLLPGLAGNALLGLAWPWLAMAFAAVAFPGRFSSLPESAPRRCAGLSTLWAALWPVLLGGVLAVGLRHFGHHLPRAPRGISWCSARLWPAPAWPWANAGARGGRPAAMAGRRRLVARTGHAAGRSHGRPGAVTGPVRPARHTSRRSIDVVEPSEVP